MSSDLQSAVESLFVNNCISLVIVTAVIYDYIITFPKEIKYVWNRPWTFVSTMFVLVRYAGLTNVLIEGLYGSTFIPGPTLVSTVLIIVYTWAFVIFLSATDLVMILRLYAMYNKSRIVLGVLVLLYAVTIALYVISAAYYNNPHTYLQMTNPQVLNMSFCMPTYTTTSKLGVYKLIPRLMLAGLMVALVAVRFCVELFQTYKATKQWEANRYLNLFVKEGLFYFIAHLLYSVDFGQTTAGFVIGMLTMILMFILAPRFIMNVRELHLRNVVFGQDTGLDTGFGLPSQILGVASIRFAESTLSNAGEDVEMGMVGSDTGSKR